MKIKQIAIGTVLIRTAYFIATTPDKELISFLTEIMIFIIFIIGAAFVVKGTSLND